MDRVVLLCGTAWLGALSAATQIDPRAQSELFVALLCVAGLAYVGVLTRVAHGIRSRRLLVVCLIAAGVVRVVMIPAAPLVSDDVFRYVWDGRVQRFGHNPYTSVPDDPSLSMLHTEVTRRIDPTSAELPTIYPPVAELFFRLVTGIHESVTSLVVAVVLCDLLTALLLWRWLVSTGRDPWWVVAYAWHPLVVLEGAGGGHIDVVGTMLVVASGFALSQRRRALAALTLAAAFAVKFLPVVLIPLYWGRVRLRHVLLGLGLVGLAYAPFTSGRLLPPVGSLGVYTQNWRFNGLLFSGLEPWLGTVGVLALAVGVGMAIAGWARFALTVDAPAAWAWPMAGSLLLMPAVYPWYLLWLIPFLTARAMWPLLAWTLGSMTTYIVWRSEVAGTGWVLPGWVLPLEYGLVAAVAWWVWRWRGPFSRVAAS